MNSEEHLGDSANVRMLLVDDDDVFRERLARAFRDRGYEVHTAPEARAAVALVRAQPFDRAVLDLKMPGDSGLKLTRDLLEIDADLQVVVLTGYGSIATAVEAVRLGAANYLQKPATVAELESAFARAQGESALVDAPAEVASLSRTEWEHINRVLVEAGGSIRKAAKLLGVDRRTLQRKLAKFPSRR